MRDTGDVLVGVVVRGGGEVGHVISQDADRVRGGGA